MSKKSEVSVSEDAVGKVWKSLRKCGERGDFVHFRLVDLAHDSRVGQRTVQRALQRLFELDYIDRNTSADGVTIYLRSNGLRPDGKVLGFWDLKKGEIVPSWPWKYGWIPEKGFDTNVFLLYSAMSKLQDEEGFVRFGVTEICKGAGLSHGWTMVKSWRTLVSIGSILGMKSDGRSLHWKILSPPDEAPGPVRPGPELKSIPRYDNLEEWRQKSIADVLSDEGLQDSPQDAQRDPGRTEDGARDPEDPEDLSGPLDAQRGAYKEVDIGGGLSVHIPPGSPTLQALESVRSHVLSGSVRPGDPDDLPYVIQRLNDLITEAEIERIRGNYTRTVSINVDGVSSMREALNRLRAKLTDEAKEIASPCDKEDTGVMSWELFSSVMEASGGDGAIVYFFIRSEDAKLHVGVTEQRATEALRGFMEPSRVIAAIAGLIDAGYLEAGNTNAKEDGVPRICFRPT